MQTRSQSANASDAASATVMEAAAVVTTAVMSSPTQEPDTVEVAQPAVFGRHSGRRGRRRKRAKKLSAAEQNAAKAAKEELDTHSLDSKYRRNMQCKLMDVVEHLDVNGGERFLKTAVQEKGWEYPKSLDIDAVEADVDGFFILFSLYLASLTHHKYENADGTKMAALHNTLKKNCTAVNNCWKHQHRRRPHKLASLMAELLSSKRKKETKLKAKGDIPDNGGREKMTFRLYRALAWYFLRRGNHFSHFFLIMCWNMMVRNCNCDDVVFTNIIWCHDSLGCSVKRTKTNSDGKKEVQTEIKHIYANPFMPEICPVLAMAMYFALFPTIGIEGCKKFFPGVETQKKFNNDVVAALEDPKFQQYLTIRGIPYKNVGAYSTRKGSTTFCTSGSTSGPSIIAVCLRAGWSIGPTLERYLRSAQAGDQFCGRVVAGLPQLTKDFAALPPHFKDVQPGPDADMIDKGIEQAFPYHTRWESSFSAVVSYMFASLIHHHDWIKSKLSDSHPLRLQPVFMNNFLAEMKQFLAVGNEVTMRATGLPAWCKLFEGIARLEELQNSMLERQEQLEKRNEQLQKIMMEIIPETIQNKMQVFFDKRDEENGSAAVLLVKRMLVEQREQMRQMQQAFAGVVEAGLPQTPAPTTPTSTTSTTPDSTLPTRGGGIWFWTSDIGPARFRQMRGRWVPKDYRLSFDLKSRKRKNESTTDEPITHVKLTVQVAWSWWWKGMKYGDKIIRPLVQFVGVAKDHFNISNAKKRYSDIKRLVEGMTKLIEDTGSVTSVAETTDEQKTMLYLQGFNLMVKFIQKYHPDNKKRLQTPKQTLAFGTMLKDYQKAVTERKRQGQMNNFVQYLLEEGCGVTKTVDGVQVLDPELIESMVDEFVGRLVEYLVDAVPKRERKPFVKRVNLL